MQIRRTISGAYNKHLLRALGFAVLIAPIMFGLAHAQAQNAASTSPKFEYEVASIKPNKSNGQGSYGITTAPDGLTVTNTPLIMLIQSAYGIFNRDRIVAAPGWVDTERYDVAAKIEASVIDDLQKLNPSQISSARNQMLQALLADRFMLALHRETRELPVYSLVVAKNGPKIHQSKTDDVVAGSNGRGGRAPGMTAKNGSIKGHSVTLGSFADFLAAQLSRPVLDRTGLTSLYDLDLQWTPDDNELQSPPGSAPNGPAIFTAIQEQLGLKLESGKGPVEVIVIDHIERPSGN
ncbi:MAG TPA: TIGR03435 family protein [Candidatus Acidoferrales bacterium]